MTAGLRCCTVGRGTRLEVTVGQGTADTDDNRRIRAATRLLLRHAEPPGLVRHRIDRLLADVSVVPAVVLPPWTPT